MDQWAIQLKPTAEWLGRVSGRSNITLDEKVARLEHYNLVLGLDETGQPLE